MSSRSNTKRRDSTTPENYFSGEFHGLKFFDTFEDNTDLDKPIGCIPNITLLDSNTKAIFDFHNCSFNHEYDQTTVILEGIQIGNGITLNDAYYYDPNIDERSNLSGSYTVSGKYDRTLVLTVNSVESAQSYDKTYKSNLFLEEFSINTNSGGISTSAKNIIKNYMTYNPDESFAHTGIRKNDKIKILNGSNVNKFLTVSSIHVDENNHELVEVTGGSLIEEDRFNQSTLFYLYRADKIEGASGATGSGGYLLQENTSSVTNVIEPEIQDNMSVISPILNPNTGKYGFITERSTEIVSPIIILQAGVPYIINRLGSSQNFAISTTEDGTHNGGKEYTGTTISFQNLLLYYPTGEDTLYYYDKVRRNAGGKIEVIGAAGDTSIFFNTNYETATNIKGIQTFNGFLFSARYTDITGGVPIENLLQSNSLGNGNQPGALGSVGY